MTRLLQTLTLCAALAVPAVALAGEAPADPRAQVTTGFGPLAHPQRPPPTLLPQPEQPKADEPMPAPVASPRALAPVPGRGRVPVPWEISMAGAGFGLLAGGVAGFSISSLYTDCSGSFFGFPSLECLGGLLRSSVIGLGTGVAGAIVGGWATTQLYRSSRASVQVSPAVGKGVQGLVLSGAF